MLSYFGINPNTSLRNIVTASGMSLNSAFKTTKHRKYHPYRMKICQEFTEDDLDRRVQIDRTKNNNVHVKNSSFILK